MREIVDSVEGVHIAAVAVKHGFNFPSVTVQLKSVDDLKCFRVMLSVFLYNVVLTLSMKSLAFSQYFTLVLFVMCARCDQTFQSLGVNHSLIIQGCHGQVKVRECSFKPGKY